MTYDVGVCRQGGFMAEAAKLYEMPGEIGDRKVYVVREGEEPHDHPGIDISISKQDSVHWISYGKKFRVTSSCPSTRKRIPRRGIRSIASFQARTLNIHTRLIL